MSMESDHIKDLLDANVPAIPPKQQLRTEYNHHKPNIATPSILNLSHRTKADTGSPKSSGR